MVVTETEQGLTMRQCMYFPIYDHGDIPGPATPLVPTGQHRFEVQSTSGPPALVVFGEPDSDGRMTHVYSGYRMYARR